jgi:hypothetical protein
VSELNLDTALTYITFVATFVFTPHCFAFFYGMHCRIPKLGFAIYLLVWWGKEQSHNTRKKIDLIFSVIFIICLVVLIIVQFYGSYILWLVAVRISKKAADDNDASHRRRSSENIEAGQAEARGEKDLEQDNEMKMHRMKKGVTTAIVQDQGVTSVSTGHESIIVAAEEEEIARERETAVNTPSSQWERSK